MMEASKTISQMNGFLLMLHELTDLAFKYKQWACPSVCPPFRTTQLNVRSCMWRTALRIISGYWPDVKHSIHRLFSVVAPRCSGMEWQALYS